jgi:hypothetical protein
MTKTHRSFPDPSSVPHFSFNISYYSTQISMGSATKTSTRDTPQVSSSAGFNSTSSSKPELQNKNSSLQTFMQANNPPLVASSNTQVVRNVTISKSKYQRPLLLFVLFFTPLFCFMFFGTASIYDLWLKMIWGGYVLCSCSLLYFYFRFFFCFSTLIFFFPKKLGGPWPLLAPSFISE